MPIATTGFAHIRLTVSNLRRSRAFYDELFGWEVAFEVPPDADAETTAALGFLFGGVIYAVPGGLLGLRPVAPETDRFSEDRIGLDHLALHVPSRASLDDAAQALDRLGVDHGDIKDIGGRCILEFRDPDGIALELYGPTT